MDIGQIVIALIVGLAAFLALGWLGFQIPAPIKALAPDGEENPSPEALPSHLPDAIGQFLAKNQAEVQLPATLAAWGRGKIASRLPVIGRVWLPLAWTLYLIPGRGFVIINRVFWFRRRFIRGGEEYRQDKGYFLLGSRPVDAPHLDETERILTWLYTAWLAPANLAFSDAVQWQVENDDHFTLSISEPEKEPLTIKLILDETRSHLRRIESQRKGSRSGENYPFEVELSQVASIDHLGQVPTHYFATWDGDAYLRLELAGVDVNHHVMDVFEAGIQAMSDRGEL